MVVQGNEDITPPTGTIQINSGHPSTNSADVTLTLSCDDGTGSGCVAMQFSNDGETYLPVPADALATAKAWSLLPGDGGKTVSVKFKDGAGNWSDPVSASIMLDTTPPEAPLVTGTTPTPTLTPAWAWSPAGGGNASYRYQLDSESGPWTEASAITAYTPINPLSEGAHTLYVQEQDNAGNWSQSGHQTINIDATKPSSLIASPGNGTVLRAGTVAIDGSAADSGSGIAKVQISINGGEWADAIGTAPWSYAWTAPEIGAFVIRSRAIDQAGNIEEPGEGIAVTVQETFKVTPSVGTGGTISPDTEQSVDAGANISFTVSAGAGFHIASVTGCGGVLTDNLYQTGTITGDCTVSATFDANLPKIGIEPISPVNFGSTKVGTTSATQTFTVTNLGSEVLVLTTIGADNDEFGLHNDTCSQQALPPAGTCTFQAAMTPKTYGSRNGLLSIRSNDPNTPEWAISLTGTGTASDISVVPASPLDFGSVNVGVASAPQTFTVTNNGNDDLFITSLESDNLDYTIEQDGCTNQTIAATASCTFQARVKPLTIGESKAVLSIISNDPDSWKLDIALLGTGNASNISVTPASPLDFAAVNVGTASAPQQITISNTGNIGLAVGLIGTSNPEFSVTNDLCSNHLVDAGGTCTCDLVFTPATSGTRNADLNIPSDDSDTPNQSLALNGVGIEVARNFQISGSAYNFPESSSYRATFSMSATGPATLGGWLKYTYTKTRMTFASTAITAVSVTEGSATISGTGTVNGVAGYTFTATVVDGAPDKFGITIKKANGTIHYNAASSAISGGSQTISVP